MRDFTYHWRMFTLITIVLSGLVIAFFATQNTETVTLRFFESSIAGVPLYGAVVGGILLGLLLSSIITLVNNISNGITLRGKESAIKDYKKDNVELTKKVHQLELENTKLRTQADEPEDDRSM